MKTVSGLTEKHLRFDVAAFVSQLRKIEGSAPDWSAYTHPSILIRAKALLWLSLTEILHKQPEEAVTEQIAVLDQRIDRDLRRFVDGAIRKQIQEVKTNLFLWMMTYEVVQLGRFPKSLQSRMKEIFDSDTVDRLTLPRSCLIKPGYLRGGQFRRRETDGDWLAISRASFNFTSYLSALNSFKRERATSFTDSTANGRIL
jgi:hypothetical protein